MKTKLLMTVFFCPALLAVFFAKAQNSNQLAAPVPPALNQFLTRNQLAIPANPSNPQQARYYLKKGTPVKVLSNPLVGSVGEKAEAWLQVIELENGEKFAVARSALTGDDSVKSMGNPGDSVVLPMNSSYLIPFDEIKNSKFQKIKDLAQQAIQASSKGLGSIKEPSNQPLSLDQYPEPSPEFFAAEEKARVETEESNVGITSEDQKALDNLMAEVQASENSTPTNTVTNNNSDAGAENSYTCGVYVQGYLHKGKNIFNADKYNQLLLKDQKRLRQIINNCGGRAQAVQAEAPKNINPDIHRAVAKVDELNQNHHCPDGRCGTALYHAAGDVPAVKTVERRPLQFQPKPSEGSRIPTKPTIPTKPSGQLLAPAQKVSYGSKENYLKFHRSYPRHILDSQAINLPKNCTSIKNLNANFTKNNKQCLINNKVGQRQDLWFPAGNGVYINIASDQYEDRPVLGLYEIAVKGTIYKVLGDSVPSASVGEPNGIRTCESIQVTNSQVNCVFKGKKFPFSYSR